MYCKNCGSQNPDDARTCGQCGQPMTPLPPQPLDSSHQNAPGQSLGQNPYSPPQTPGHKVPNHLVWSILVTIFCCLPLGIAAIVHAARVNTMLQLGDYNGAIRESNQAKKWCWWGFGLGLVLNVLMLIIRVGLLLATYGDW